MSALSHFVQYTCLCESVSQPFCCEHYADDSYEAEIHECVVFLSVGELPVVMTLCVGSFDDVSPFVAAHRSTVVARGLRPILAVWTEQFESLVGEGVP